MSRDYNYKSVLYGLFASSWYLPVQALPKTHLVVYSALGQQVFVSTALNNFPPREDNDTISVLYGAESMRDSALCFLECGLDDLLGLSVKCKCRFVQKQ